MSDNSSQEGNCHVHIYMKVVDANNRKVLFDTGENDFIKTDAITAKIFLRHHARDLSVDLSGYSGDISSEDVTTTSEDLRDQLDGLKQQKRWASIGSTISTIPTDREISRFSRPTTISSSSSVFNDKDVSPIKDRRADGNREPILSSTKIGSSFATIEEAVVMSSTKMETPEKKPIVDEQQSNSNKLLSNGEVDNKLGVDEKHNVTTSDASTEMQVNDVDVKVENSSDSVDKPGSDDGDGGNQPAPKARGRKRRKNNTSKSESNDSKNSTSVGQNTQKAKRPRKATDIFDPSSNESTSIDEGAKVPTNDGNATSNSSHNNSNNKISTDASNSTDGSPVVEATGSRMLEPEDAANLAKSATLWGCIGIGEWVFARWRDKNYYSGKITEKGLNDTWNIHFEDNMDGVASETHILPIKIIGVDVKAVYSPDNVYRPSLVTVTGQKFADDQMEKVEYAITCKDLPFTLLCHRKQLSLKESEAKELRRNYQSTLPKLAADLSLDNIMAGPRRRGMGQSGSRKIVGGAFDSSLADDSMLRDSGAGTPTPKRTAPSKLASATKSTSSSFTTTLPTELDTSSSDTGYIGSHLGTPSLVNPSTPKTQPGGNSVHSKDTPKGVLKESAKKGKSKDKGLFDGFQFFLTASGGGDPSSSGDDEPVLPYDKDEYKDSIESKGGKVIDSVGREKGRDNVFLISDSHARTVKYIYCLAAAIPCVSHTWIGQCLEKNTVVDWKPFELSSGWSLEEEKVIPAHQKKPLRNLKVYVTAEQDDLYNYWKPVLLAAEATLLKPKKKPVGVPPDTEILVTDSSCSQEVLDMVKRNNIPLVKPEWLVQTIITGTRADYTGHLKYHVNPSGELEEEEEDT